MSKSGIFTAIKGRLEDPACNLGLKKVGLYNSQYDNDNKEEPYGSKSAFIEFREIFHSTENKNFQKSDYLVTIHVGYESYKESSSLSTELTDVKALDFFDSVYACLQGFMIDCPDTTPMLRKAERSDINHNNIIHWEIDFSFTAQDADGEDDKDKTIIVGGTVTAKIIADLDIDNPVVRTGDGEI